MKSYYRQQHARNYGGTGLLLSKLADRFPDAELTGLDTSSDMLEQAQRTLQGRPHIHLLQAKPGANGQTEFPFAPGTFDLITCTNTLHYFPNLLIVLQTWREILVEGGHVVVEDYLLRRTPLPWHAFEWAIKLYDPQHVRLYLPTSVQSLSQRAGFQVLSMHRFPIDLFCQGWVLNLQGD